MNVSRLAGSCARPSRLVRRISRGSRVIRGTLHNVPFRVARRFQARTWRGNASDHGSNVSRANHDRGPVITSAHEHCGRARASRAPRARSNRASRVGGSGYRRGIKGNVSENRQQHLQSPIRPGPRRALESPQVPRTHALPQVARALPGPFTTWTSRRGGLDWYMPSLSRLAGVSLQRCKGCHPERVEPSPGETGPDRDTDEIADTGGQTTPRARFRMSSSN